MQYEQVTTVDLSLLEKSVPFELRMMKRVDPSLPVTKADLAKRLHRQRGEIFEALHYLDEDFRLVGPLVLDLQNIELTELGEELPKRLNGCAARQMELASLRQLPPLGTLPGEVPQSHSRFSHWQHLQRRCWQSPQAPPFCSAVTREGGPAGDMRELRR
jgi:hypothetical protein